MYNQESIREMIAECASKVGGQKALSDLIGITAQYVNDILRSRRNPGPRVLSFFGLVKEISFSPDPHERVEPITDSMGNTWSPFCLDCGTRSIHVVRPGSVDCYFCERAGK